jgi:hypothetical protein
MVNTNKNDWINPNYKKYYERLNISEKYKEWKPTDMMKTYKKIEKKKTSSESDSQPGWTNQTHDLIHEIKITP